MGIAGFGKTQIRYDMFSLSRDADAARRYSKCERIYHKSQDLAWDGKDVLGSLMEEHGGIQLDARNRKALEQIFAIILWGEMAAWKISLQLADRLEPMEAKMAATSQAFDEARHFYVMHDYLEELGYRPKRLDRAPQALLDLTLDTPKLAYKLLGMQLLIEPLALTLFQAIRQARPEPVIAELMKYYERDEARHVGLGMQYFPLLLRDMGRLEVGALLAFQARLMFWVVLELKVLEPHLRVLGLDPRDLLLDARSKQIIVLQEAFEAIGAKDDDRMPGILSVVNAGTELLFPTEENRRDPRAQFGEAWRVFTNNSDWAPDLDSLSRHMGHRIRTARQGFGGRSEVAAAS